MKALGIGQINLDQVSLFNNYPSEGGKFAPEKVTESVGSPVPAALILLSRLGVKCNLIASIGRDESGEKLKKTLDNENVNLIPRYDKVTRVHQVLVNKKNGSRTIIKDNTRLPFLEKISKRTIQQADIIIFDRHEPVAFNEVVKHKREDARVIIDPSTEISEKTLEMYRHSDYPIIPIECLDLIHKHNDKLENLHKIYEISQKTVIITAGSQGCLVYDGKKIDVVKPCNIDPIDTLGAGDVFRGAFGFGVLNNWEITKTVKYANTVAALHCLRVGNSEAIPTKREISKFEETISFREIAVDQILN